MKRIFLASLLCTAIMTTVAYATPVNQHALEPTMVTTVKDVQQLKDNSKVLLKGQVVKSLGDEKYEFRDATGMIKVEIDDELWHGHAVSATETLTLVGEVDIDYKPIKRVEIDVKEVKLPD
ncbi:MAG: NirD/YgiW/YdeI family stress tolerance protein [Acinetobacter sp.]|nr:MAG: NirD/YgiW/YdeI family stress tolerance protein [Acinetobacter sp.]